MSTKISRRQFVTMGTAAAFLAACAKGQTPEAPGAATEPPTAPPAAATIVAEVEATQDLSNTNLEQIVRLSEQKITLKAFSCPVYTATDVTSFNDQLFDKKMEELTNVHLAWEHAAEYGDAPFELRMASGDLPDVIAGVWSISLFAKYGQKGAFEPLNDYISANQYFSSVLKNDPIVKAMITAPDGNIYAYPRYLETGQRAFGGFFLRQDWLDEVGMGIPGTIDEYYGALKACKQRNPERYPLAGYMQSLGFMIWQWGVGSRGPNQGSDFYLDGDQILYGPIQPQFREALVFLNKLFQEGLVDPEYATLSDYAAAYKRWTDGIVGIGFGWADDFASLMKADPDMQLVGHKPPQGPYGHREVLSNHMAIDPTNGGGLTISCSNKEIAAKYFDLYYSRSGAILMNFGVYGDTYVEENGELKYTDKVLNDPKLVPLEYIWNYVSPTWIGPMYMMTAQERGLYTGKVGQAQILWDEEPWQTIQLPPLTFTDDENAVIQEAMTDISTLVDESIAGFVNGSKDLDTDYAAMVEAIRGLGIDRVTAVYQGAYDRFQSYM